MVRASVALVCCLSAVSLAQSQSPPAPEAQSPTEAAATAPTPTGGGADWSMRSGQTMGEGQSAVAGQAGWPGIQTEYMVGIKPFLDLGGRFEFDWSFLGDTRAKGPGIKFHGIIRVHVFDAGKVIFSARFEPGFMAFFFGDSGASALAPVPSGPPPALRARTPAQVTVPDYSSSYGPGYYGTTTSLTLPVALEAGFPVQPGFLLNARFSVPLTFVLGDYGGTVVPLMFGVGTEYRFNPRLALVADLGAGPIFYINGGTDFGLNAMVGVAYKL
ncbi:MAG TPA: hypothetical protein VMT11_01130 [Myxococcaceae bacterium]|nr:hypothetical protein [Myxococcaceae bacterium]